jgi:hypothetical protein
MGFGFELSGKVIPQDGHQDLNGMMSQYWFHPINQG